MGEHRAHIALVVAREERQKHPTLLRRHELPLGRQPRLREVDSIGAQLGHRATPQRVVAVERQQLACRGACTSDGPGEHRGQCRRAGGREGRLRQLV